MDRDEAEALFDRLKTASHYHVISQQMDKPDELAYTDGHIYERAIEFATELVESDDDLAAVWVVEAMGIGCPLLHGDPDSLSYAEGESNGADEFLLDALSQEPFWRRD